MNIDYSWTNEKYIDFWSCKHVYNNIQRNWYLNWYKSKREKLEGIYSKDLKKKNVVEIAN